MLLCTWKVNNKESFSQKRQQDHFKVRNTWTPSELKSALTGKSTTDALYVSLTLQKPTQPKQAAEIPDSTLHAQTHSY